MQDAYYEAISRLPPGIGELLHRLPPEQASKVTEIRLRAQRPLQLVFCDYLGFLSQDGQLCDTANNAVTISSGQLTDCFLTLCQHSVHTYQQELRQGFFTLSGGHRVGVAGTAVCEGDEIKQIKDIASLNLRVARPVSVVPDAALLHLLQQERGGIMIVGEPKSGKTTVLRMISSLLSQAGQQIVVVDQRREIWPTGQSAYQPPDCCDVLSGYPRAEGILQALRCLSPDVILCDEIGSEADAKAVESGVHAGVRLIVSIHAQSKEELLRRPQAKLLLQTGAFEKFVLLAGKKQPGKVSAIYDCNSLF